MTQATTTDEVRLVIAARAGLLRESLGRLLDREEGFELVGQAGTPEEVLRLAATGQPDVILLDCGLLDALPDLLSALEEAPRPPKVLLLSEGPLSPGSAEAILLGAWGALAPEAPVDQFRKAIRTVASGEHWIGHDAVADIVGRLRLGSPRRTDAAPGRWARLTPREREMARGAAAGESNRELAHRLGLTEGTVKSHLGKVYKKLGLSGRAALAKWIGKLPAESEPRRLSPRASR
jgi:DNA-binding NarL/FixJ family response regulator